MSEELAIQDVVHQPLPGFAFPASIAFSPDDKLVTFLWSEERTLSRQLFAFDVETKKISLMVKPIGNDSEKGLSLEEQMRRERLRLVELGITHYLWAKHANRILVPIRGDIFIQEQLGSELKQVYLGSDALNPQLSPDGQRVAFVKNGEVHVINIDGSNLKQLTFGEAEHNITNGLADYLAQEEMERLDGFWWSPDSKFIAFEQVDENHIPIFTIVHQGKDTIEEEQHRFPFAGKENPKVRLGVVSIQDATTNWMDLGNNDDIYLARVDWFPNGELTAQIQNREQTTLDLVKFSENGKKTVLLTEKHDNGMWINLHKLLRPIQHGQFANHFIWASERSGFQHLYLYTNDGKLVRTITSGNWLVEEINGVDEERGVIYYCGTQQDAREKHLYAVNINGSSPRQLTKESGWHDIIIDNKLNRYIDTYQSIDTPPQVIMKSLHDNSSFVIFDQRDPRIDQLSLKPPELVSFSSHDGVTLYGALYKPPSRFGSGPFPTIVQVYGGPHVQLVQNAWRTTTFMRVQKLRSKGFLLFVLDNRGSSRRGQEFEKPIKYDLGNIEVQDQVEGVEWLINQGLTDPERVGIFGWSYGGYMSLMCLARAPKTFHVAVAGAPVTHWDGYDTHYTERYMGIPEKNPKEYEKSSVMHHVGNIKGKMMLIHGMIDENVHFRHTARLIKALNRERKQYDLFLLADDRHRPRSLSDMIYMEERVVDYFVQHLRLPIN